ncbi:MAG: sigma-54 dependent transcriptional regulator [Gemmatimonadales bacterium]|jgi:DNA-binding NtrC family response regulator
MATVLVTTSDLEAAGRLQAAFEPVDNVSFVTDAHDVRAAIEREDVTDAAFIATGALRDSVTRAMIARLLTSMPAAAVIALLDEGEKVRDDLAAGLELDESFVKPIDPDEVVLVTRRRIQRKRLQYELGILGRSEAVQEVVEWILQIAPVGSTVLITGESGTGKELVARGLHWLSRRRGNPFIPVNIAALPETLLESELFGHEKGAFTGASSRRKGMFELANGGTIFLDEIAEMPLAPQTRLLRVLEQREFMRVGGSESIKVDVRVIAATNRDLRQAVELGEFRRDLYFRLNVLHIDMPPLRERREDIPLLVREFARQLSKEHDREFKGIAPDAMDLLMRYDWPGNVRELRNLVESMVVLAPGSIVRSADIPPEVRRGAQRSLPSQVPAPPSVVRQQEGAAAPAQLAEMEFIFRTLVDLKFDVDDLRREFELYKRRHPELTGPREAGVVDSLRFISETNDVVDPQEEVVGGEAAEERLAGVEGEETVIFHSGMTMEELERGAIAATLRSVGGNRRRAAEKLGIGERTLYRKLKEYDIEA